MFFLALAVGFLVANGKGRNLELFIVAIAVLAAYFLSWRRGRWLAPAAIVAYLYLEHHYGRLGHDQYWGQVFFAVAIGGGVLCSAYLRRDIDTRNDGLGLAYARVGELRAQHELESKLLGPAPLNPLDLELERARRYNHCVGLIVIRPDDVDDIAVRFGELGSTEVLGEVADAVGRNLRAMDRPRLDEPLGFVIVLPETMRDGARVVAERIRLDVARRRLDFGEGELVNLSVTIGLAAFPEDALTNEQLVTAARRAYAAGVKLGGNRTVMASVPEGAPAGWGLPRDEAVADAPVN